MADNHDNSDCESFSEFTEPSVELTTTTPEYDIGWLESASRDDGMDTLDIALDWEPLIDFDASFLEESNPNAETSPNVGTSPNGESVPRGQGDSGYWTEGPIPDTNAQIIIESPQIISERAEMQDMQTRLAFLETIVDQQHTMLITLSTYYGDMRFAVQTLSRRVTEINAMFAAGDHSLEE